MNVSAAAAALSANAGAGVVAQAPGVDWNDVSGGGDFAGSAVGVGFADILPGTCLCAMECVQVPILMSDSFAASSQHRCALANEPLAPRPHSAHHATRGASNGQAAGVWHTGPHKRVYHAVCH